MAKKLVDYLDFSAQKERCIWLFGKNDPNIDVLWAASSFEFSNQIEAVENIALFESRDYKCIFRPEFGGFLKVSDRKNWTSKLLIKGTDDAKLPQSDDLVLDFESKFSLQDLLRNFAAVYGLDFSPDQWKFIEKNAKDLKDLAVFGILQSAEIGLEDWDSFTQGVPASWYARFKSNLLLQDAIVTGNPIPILQYFVRADFNPVRKGISQFLLATIKNGDLVWEQNGIWHDFVRRVYG